MYYLPFPRIFKKSEKSAESLEMDQKRNDRVKKLIANKCSDLGPLSYQANSQICQKFYMMYFIYRQSSVKTM